MSVQSRKYRIVKKWPEAVLLRRATAGRCRVMVERVQSLKPPYHALAYKKEVHIKLSIASSQFDSNQPLPIL